MKTAARLFLGASAYGIASYLVFGPDRVMIVMCMKVWLVYVLIMLMIGCASLLLGDDK
jgi:hypothetical protein